MSNQTKVLMTDSEKRFSLDQMLAIIVLYNQELEYSETLISLDKSNLNGEKIDVFIYDNSPKIQRPSQSKFKNFKFVYFHDPLNSGISKAYNSGAEIAKKMGKSWLLFLDQDTNFGIDYLEKIKLEVNRNSNINLFAPILKLNSNEILSPYKFKYFHGTHLKNISPGIHNIKKCQPINSGILIYLKSFEEAGGYNENIKLDFSDHQFFEKFKKIEYNFVVLDSIGIQNFSAHETDLNRIINRFRFYCEGALYFETSNSMGYYILHFFLILKIIKQCLKHNTLIFFDTYLKEIKKHKLNKK